ncbi:MAG: hypothetical protein JO253_02955 [Alphaproteobacteria bacterium]|nr:hypothetical protein [Alphaproteobacteria bacterium]
MNEAQNAGTPLNASLEAGIDVLSLSQEVVFTQYQREVLPLDGFIFWLRTSTTKTIQGSLHYSINSEQREDESIALRSVIFTAREQVDDLAAIAPNMLWVAQVDEDYYAFSQQGNFYEQAGIYHYQGFAVWPAMQSQLIDNINDLNPGEAVVSNSLPFWLTLNAIMPVYPSFLIPQDIRPPYAAIHIDPATTRAIQAAPLLDYELSHFQLTQETVKITMYGVRNNEALDYLDYICQYSLSSDAFGIMNMPVVRDEKRTQSETTTIAQKKSIEFEINYYQTRLNNETRQFILKTIQNYIINPL